MSMPASLPVQMLRETNPILYDKNMLKVVEDLFDSRRMALAKDTYLRPRQNDVNAAYLNARQNSAQYTNHFNAKLQSIAAEILSDPPRIITAVPSLFWDCLNENFDNCGGDLKSIALQALLELLKHGRAYFLVQCPAPGVFSVTSLPASTVDDIQVDDGITTMIREHKVSYERPADYLPLSIEKNSWTFYRADGIFTYTARRPMLDGKFDRWPRDQKATLEEFQNALPCCPVFAVNVPNNLSIGHNLAAPAISLYCRESAREFCLDSGALAMPVLCTENRPEDINLSELNVLSVGLNGSFGWSSPSADVFSALKQSSDDQRGLFDRGVAAPASHENQTQNARQSGKAKEMDMAPKRNLLSTYSDVLEDGLEAVINAIAHVHNDQGVEPRLTGLFSDEPDAADVVLETLDFVALPGVPDTAKRIAVQRAIDAFLPDLSAGEKKEIKSELRSTGMQAQISNINSHLATICGTTQENQGENDNGPE